MTQLPRDQRARRSRAAAEAALRPRSLVAPHLRHLCHLWLMCVIGLIAVTPTAAQDGSGPATVIIDGPQPPVAPATITRDAQGRATIRAIKLSEPLCVDGSLDERVYRDEPPFGDLLQVVPRHRQPSTEKTDIWVTYDTTHIYISARCHDSAPPDLRHLLRPAQRVHVLHQPARRPGRLLGRR